MFDVAAGKFLEFMVSQRAIKANPETIKNNTWYAIIEYSQSYAEIDGQDSHL